MSNLRNSSNWPPRNRTKTRWGLSLKKFSVFWKVKQCSLTGPTQWHQPESSVVSGLRGELFHERFHDSTSLGRFRRQPAWRFTVLGGKPQAAQVIFGLHNNALGAACT